MIKKILMTLTITSTCYAASPKYKYGQVVEWKDDFYGTCTGKLRRIESDEPGHIVYEVNNVKCDSGYYSIVESASEKSITRLVK